jgi:cyclase
LDKWKMISATEHPRTRFGEIPRYAEGLYELNNRIYTWMLPNGCWYESNAGLVVGDGESLLVDTLADLNLTGEMLEAMEPFTQDAPIKHLVNTHSDGDHFWGNELLGDTEIIMTKACEEESRELKPAAMALLGKTGGALALLPVKKAKKIGSYFHNMVAPYDFKGIKVRTANRTFEKEMVLDVGGREVRLIEVGPAHTRGDLIAYVPDAKTIFAGDMLFAGATPVLWAGPVENWIAALDKMLELDVDTIVPGHGPICGKEVISQTKGYWEYLESEAGRCFEAGISANDAAFEIALGDEFSRRGYSRWDSAERIMTNVHIIHKHLQKRIGHLKPAEKLNILRKQALLAYEMPEATPAIMRTL